MAYKTKDLLVLIIHSCICGHQHLLEVYGYLLRCCCWDEHLVEPHKSMYRFFIHFFFVNFKRKQKKWNIDSFSNMDMDFYSPGAGLLIGRIIIIIIS